MKRALPPVIAAAALAGCATGDWQRMEAEFVDVRANCGVPGARLEHDRSDERLVWLVYPHRSDMISATGKDGRFGCFEHWARERGYRLQPAGANGPGN